MPETPAFWGLISSYAGLLFLATASIYGGAWASLPGDRAGPGQRGGPDDDDDDEEIPESITSSDAWMFPIIGGSVLLGFYFAMRYLGREWINWIIGWYFAATGVLAVWKTSTSLCRSLTPEATWKSFRKRRILISTGSSVFFDSSLRTPSLLLFLPSIIPSALYIYLADERKPALLSNILALSFSHTALSILRLDSFKTGIILLSGLFLYDIFFVFGTEVMVTVATGLDLPIKIVWPKSLAFSATAGFSMLGLGDIVIPGSFITLALRYDLHRSPSRSYKAPFSKPYFNSALVAYVLGLLATIIVMHNFRAAQPALLYLSPACITSFFLTAVARGDLAQALAYEDGSNGNGDVAKPPAVGEQQVTLVGESTASSSTSDIPGRSDRALDSDLAGNLKQRVSKNRAE